MKANSSATKQNFVSDLVEDMIRHEGYVNAIYSDSLGYKTLGIGHLVLSYDDEHFKEVGMPVSNWRVADYFFKDLSNKFNDCKRLYPDIETYPEEVQLILINMMFNLGYNKLSKFKKMKAAIERNDWKQAAEEMKDSLWFKQVKSRGVELYERMRNV